MIGLSHDPIPDPLPAACFSRCRRSPCRRHHRRAENPRGRHCYDRLNRIRLGGIDAPSTDQLCLNPKGERWTCGVAARDELIKHFGNKSWTCHARTDDRRGRTVARCEVDGEDIQKWMVSNGWALAYTRVSHDYEADEKAAREAKAGMWQGAFIAPWDWRVRNKKTTILGAQAAGECHAILLASASGEVAPSPDCTIKGNVNSVRRMHLSQADQPLVRADQDEDHQGHALVLLGRGSRSRRLPRDAAVAPECSRAARAAEPSMRG